MSITPCLPDQIHRGNVFTWVNSQWKLEGLPGHFSAEINTEKDKKERDRTAQEVRVLKQTVAQLQRQQREKKQGFLERWLGVGGRSKNPARAGGRKTVRTN